MEIYYNPLVLYEHAPIANHEDESLPEEPFQRQDSQQMQQPALTGYERMDYEPASDHESQPIYQHEEDDLSRSLCMEDIPIVYPSRQATTSTPIQQPDLNPQVRLDRIDDMPISTRIRLSSQDAHVHWRDQVLVGEERVLRSRTITYNTPSLLRARTNHE